MKKKVQHIRKNYSKEPNCHKMESAIEEAKAQDHPNLKEISEKYQVSRKALSDRFLGKLKLRLELGKNLT